MNERSYSICTGCILRPIEQSVSYVILYVLWTRILSYGISMAMLSLLQRY